MLSFFSGDEARIRTGLGAEKYAATHQFGDAERNIEARPYLGLSAEVEIDTLDIISEYFDRMV